MIKLKPISEKTGVKYMKLYYTEKGLKSLSDEEIDKVTQCVRDGANEFINKLERMKDGS